MRIQLILPLLLASLLVSVSTSVLAAESRIEGKVASTTLTKC